RARKVSRRRLESSRLYARDGGHHGRAAALQVFICEQALSILLQSRGLADAEDDLADRSPHPFLRVPQRKEARLEAKRHALVVEAKPTREVVEGELHVVELRPEVGLVRPAHALAGAGLVVDDLDLAIADVVDAVDLADDLDPIELQVETLLQRDRPQPAHA